MKCMHLQFKTVSEICQKVVVEIGEEPKVRIGIRSISLSDVLLIPFISLPKNPGSRYQRNKQYIRQ